MKSLFTKVLLLFAMFFGSSAYAQQKVEFTVDNTVLLRDEVNGDSISKVLGQLMTNPHNELYLFISSPGGSIFDGLHLVTYLQHTTKKITCVTNMAASMAFIIFEACPRRLVTDDAVLMQHVASYGVKGQAPNNVSMVNFLQRMIKKVDLMQSKRLGMTYDQFKAKTRDDWWLFGGEAIEAKAADSFAVATCSPELTKKTHKQRVSLLFTSVDVTWSDCPLIDAPLEIKEVEKRVKRETKEAREEMRQFLKNLDWRARLMARFSGDTSVELPLIYGQ